MSGRRVEITIGVVRPDLEGRSCRGCGDPFEADDRPVQVLVEHEADQMFHAGCYKGYVGLLQRMAGLLETGRPTVARLLN